MSSHACGALTSSSMRAAGARARVAVLPCCHDLAVNDAGPLTGWVDAPRPSASAARRSWSSGGYDVRTQAIPVEITPKNRLLLGAPAG